MEFSKNQCVQIFSHYFEFVIMVSVFRQQEFYSIFFPQKSII